MQQLIKTIRVGGNASITIEHNSEFPETPFQITFQQGDSPHDRGKCFCLSLNELNELVEGLLRSVHFGFSKK